MLSLALAFPERGPNGEPTGREISAKTHFVAHKPMWEQSRVATPITRLGEVARDTAAVMRAQRDSGDPALHAGVFKDLGWTLDDVLRTLDFVARVAADDAGRAEQRLADPAFLDANFEVLRWEPDLAAARSRGINVDPHTIRLTKYLIYEAQGSPTRTERFDTALYAVPRENEGETPARLRYTRQDVYAGCFEPGGAAEGLAKPLVWLTREQSNRALMQGSVMVSEGGANHLFNVHQNNDIPYDPAIKDGNLQPRFWYFREVDGLAGYDVKGQALPLAPEVVVAGDVYNLGLGKLAFLQGAGELRLVVLADTGGAFQPNLFQLDYLAGQYPTHEAFLRATQHLPERVQAGFLRVRKDAPAL